VQRSELQVRLAEVEEKYEALRSRFDERTRRLWAAAEARALGHGGIVGVGRATGMSHSTIRRGIRELEEPDSEELVQVRRRGGGRTRMEEHDPTLLDALAALLEPSTRGDPESPLKWTTLSTPKIAEALAKNGYRLSAEKVRTLLHEQGYSLQAPSKTQDHRQHPDRDAQFRHIQSQVSAHQARDQPVISVDTKKKELVGNFHNKGREWRPQGEPDEVLVYDFVSNALGKAIPYGVYDIEANEGWVNVGMDHDTPRFAVASIRRWWDLLGRHRYPDATELLITADGGGSNGHRPRAWKYHLHRLAQETGLTIRVCHFPPGASKWNKIEHRLFSQISLNWRGRALISYETVVNLIANTRNANGLEVVAKLDRRKYPLKERITDKQLRLLNLERDDFHGDWNYALLPAQPPTSPNL